MPTTPAYIYSILGFQSAPGLEAGRCELPAAAQAAFRWFQSAPGLEAGRCSRVWRSA